MPKTKVKKRPPKARQERARIKGPESQQKKTRIRRTTERTLLQTMVAQLEADPAHLEAIYTECIEKAKAGDEKARDFIGKYLLGGGKISLDELWNPPLIKKSRS